MSAGSITPESRSRELRQDRRQVVVGKTVLLVEHDDRPFAQPGQLDQGRVLAADQVMIDDEEQQIGTDGQSAGLDLSRLAGFSRLGHAGRVGHGNGRIDRPQLVGVALAVAGRSHDRLGRAHVAAEQGVDQRGLARRHGAEDDHVRVLTSCCRSV